MSEILKSNIEPENQEQAIMEAHLKGLLGNLETLKRWGGKQENDDRTEEEIERDEKNLGSYFKKTFGSETVGPKCEELLAKTKQILDNPKLPIDKKVYDEIFAEWNSIKK